MSAKGVGSDSADTANGQAVGAGISIGYKYLAGPASIDIGTTLSYGVTLEKPGKVGTQEFTMDGIGLAVLIGFGYNF